MHSMPILLGVEQNCTVYCPPSVSSVVLPVNVYVEPEQPYCNPTGKVTLKNALASYWKHVARRGLAYKELSYNFVALGIERELARTQGDAAITKLIRRVSRIMACDDDRALMNAQDIDMQSNLNSEVLTELFEKLGIDGSPLVTKHHFIDFALLKNRNSIAHGEYLSMSIGVYTEAHTEALNVMNTVRNIISNAANTGRYRRISITPGALTSS